MSLFIRFVHPSCHISCFSPSPTPIEVAPSSWFKIGSSSTTIPDPASEATTFFTWFDQPKVNDLDLVDFWGAGSPYVDFHSFWVLRECISHLEVVYNSCEDFMQVFLLG